MHVVNDRFLKKKKANDASIENGWLLVTCGPLKRGKDQLLVMGLKWLYIGLLLDQRYTNYLSTRR